MNRNRIVEVFLRRPHAYGNGKSLHHFVCAVADDVAADNFLLLTDRN
jgi:hypothetical protein